MYGVSGLSNMGPVPITSNAHNWVIVDPNVQPLVPLRPSNVGDWYEYSVTEGSFTKRS